MMRILHILNALDGGGVENMLLNYYSNMSNKKIHFDFVVHTDNGSLDEDFRSLNSKIYCIPSRNNSLLRYICDLRKIITEGKYNVIHVHQGVGSVVAVFIAKIVGVKIRIVHSHLAYQRNQKNRKLLSSVIHVALRKISTHWLACSDDAAISMWGRKAFEMGKVNIIYNAIDLRKFTYDLDTRCRVRNHLGISDKFVVGNVSRFTNQKNHNFLIDIFCEIRKIKENSVLLLIGNGNLEDEIKEKVQSLGLNSDVIFLGVRRNINELLQGMDVFVLPSLYEGLGIVLVESQAADLTTFASQYVIPREVKITKKLNFIDLDDNAAIWASRILENINAKRENIYSEIKESNYNIFQQVNELENFYLNLSE